MKNFIKKLLVGLAAVAAFGAWNSVQADSAPPVIIIKSAAGESGDATINFTGISGNDELNALIPIFIRASGWLKPQASGADYMLRGAANSTTCDFVIYSGETKLYAERVSFSNPREGAQKVVDSVLQQLIRKENVKELCQSRIAFCVTLAKGKSEIYTCDIAGGDLKQITDFGSFCVEPSWAPHSRSIGYTKYNKSSTDILETRLKPLGTRRLTSFPGLNVGAAFDPAFKRLAFVGSFENVVELYVQDIGGKSQTRLSKGSGVEASPCWNPAGDTICYVSNEGGRTPRLFTVNLAAKTRTRLKTLGSEAATPDWSVKNQIVYAAKVNGSYKLAVLDMNGDNEPQIISSDAGEWESPSWAPDGRHIVCARTVGGKTSLYIVDATDGASRLLLQTNNKLTMPSWSPGAVKF